LSEPRPPRPLLAPPQPPRLPLVPPYPAWPSTSSNRDETGTAISSRLRPPWPSTSSNKDGTGVAKATSPVPHCARPWHHHTHLNHLHRAIEMEPMPPSRLLSPSHLVRQRRHHRHHQQMPARVQLMLPTSPRMTSSHRRPTSPRIAFSRLLGSLTLLGRHHQQWPSSTRPSPIELH
jgi:hypothetical protein